MSDSATVKKVKRFYVSYSSKSGAKVVILRALQHGKTLFVPQSFTRRWRTRDIFLTPADAIKNYLADARKDLKDDAEGYVLDSKTEIAAVERLLKEYA